MLISNSHNRIAMAFVSMHRADEAERKILGYIYDGEFGIELITKKFSRVPEEHESWLWGKIENKISSDEELTSEQENRFNEVKEALDM